MTTNTRRAILIATSLVALSTSSGCGSADDPAGSAAAVASPSSSTSSTSGTADSSAQLVNTWSAPPADLTKLPLGNSHVSTTEYGAGTLFVCDAGRPGGPGAFAAGPWINETKGTWNANEKVAVKGKVSWPMATYSEVVKGGSRTIRSGGLPVDDVTGTFPIAADDPAYSYDRNPNSISKNDISITLPVVPTVAKTPRCLTKGAIGVLKNGVALFAPVDEQNRDAVAYETQDVCDGHPQQSGVYHYHGIPSCILGAAKGASTVVGFAYDGFPIVVERDQAGELPTSADLDQCHGRTSRIVLDGKVVTSYHYSATRDFPYSIGCLRGANP